MVAEHSASRAAAPPPPSPFALALRSAIADSGLGLDRLRHRLVAQGLGVSTATLSYWQTGRSTPSGIRSLKVLAALEQILGVEPRSLLALLPAPRPRGRSAGAMAPDPTGLPHWDKIAAAAEEMGLTHEDRLRQVSCHMSAEIGQDRTVVAHRIRNVLRAVVDGVGRYPLYCCDELPHPELPRIVPIVGFRVGQHMHDPVAGLTVIEAILDTELAAGELVFLEYEIAHGPMVMTELELRNTHPVHEAVKSIRFHPEAIPSTVVEYTEVAGQGRSRAVSLDRSGAVSIVRHNLGPGALGLHWTWPESDT